MSGLTDSEREGIALMLSDALMPCGLDFDAPTAARLIEARLERMLDQRAAEALRAVRTEPWGAWVAYYSDGSGVSVFETEVEALRHANGCGGMRVIYMHNGEDIPDAEKRAREAKA